MARRRELFQEIQPLVTTFEDHPRDWAAHEQGDRFRHTTRFSRARPDRTPESCTYEQLERPLTYDLADIVPGLKR